MSAQDFHLTALTFTVTGGEDQSHPMQGLIDEGALDCLSGALWWNNPYPSGTWQSYAWEKGHSSIREGSMIQ